MENRQTGGGGGAAVNVGAVATLAILYAILGTNLQNGTQKIDANAKIEHSK